MNNGPLFSFARRKGASADAPEVLAAFLNLTPAAMAVLDKRSRRIQEANQPFSELIGIAPAALAGRDIDGLLPGWESGRAALPGGSALRVASVPLQPKGMEAVAIAADGPPPGALQPERYLKFWGNLNRLWRAQDEPDLIEAMTMTLSAAQALTGAGTLAVYRLLPDQPLLKRCCALDADGILPDELPAQDLVGLNRIRLWESSKRPTGPLPRAARQAGLVYLASAPLGNEAARSGGVHSGSSAAHPEENKTTGIQTAMIGAVVLGGKRLPDLEFSGKAPAAPIATLVQPVMELLAAQITTLFQNSARLTSLSDRLAEQEQELRLAQTLEEQSAAGMIVLDSGLNITRLNQAAERILGYNGAQTSGVQVNLVLIGAEGLDAALEDAQQGRSTYRMEEVRLYRRNGEAFLARLRVVAMSSCEGRISGPVDHIIVFIEDLSAEEIIRRQTEQLEQRALLGEVMAVFAHEVRNPINNISTGLQVMGMDLPADDPRQAGIGRMLQDCDRLAELLRSVLAYARPAEYEMETLDIGGLLRRLLDRLHARIAARNVQYSLHVEPGCPAAMGDLRALEQVFNNLIGNALQAMEAQGGHLILKAYPVSEDGRLSLEISVADTGPGISRDAQERIFQPFFTTEKNGTGLGLAIVKRIITAHKGSITLTSFPGGTIFRVRLPAAPPAAAE